MSNKQTDLYLEEVARAEEDVRDALLALGEATKDRQEAEKWEQNRLDNFKMEENRLKALKDKDL